MTVPARQTTINPATNANARRLPSGVERAIADSLSLEHPDVAWTPPPSLPSASDLRTAIEILDAQSAQASRQHVAWCLAKLSMAFEPSVKLSKEDEKFRASIWVESCGDLGDTLWSEATMAAIQSLKWMPKPAEFRALVGGKIGDRAKRLKRCRDMLAALGGDKPATPKPFEPEPREVRLRSMRDSYCKHGYADRAARIEVELAAIEGREPEDWTRAAQAEAGNPATAETPTESPARPPSPAMRGALDAALARQHRAQGRTEYAGMLERRAAAGMPTTGHMAHDDPPLPDAIPEWA